MHIQLSQKQQDEFPEVVGILSVSEHTIAMYHRENNTVIVDKTLHYDELEYTDNEGHFKTKNHHLTGGSSTGTIRSGNANEKNEKGRWKHFLHQSKKEIQDWDESNTIDEVYIAIPNHLQESLADVLPTSVRKKYTVVLHGNYTNHPLDELIDAFADEISIDTTSPPKRKEVKKILKKNEIAVEQ